MRLAHAHNAHSIFSSNCWKYTSVTTVIRGGRSQEPGTLGVSRVFGLLRELASHNREGMRMTDIARRLRIEPPTAHRILKCLVEERVLSRDKGTKHYHLGPLVFELGIVATPKVDIRPLCEPSIDRIARETGDVVFLTRRSDRDAVCLSRKDGRFPVKTFTLEVGMRRPLGVGAGSLAILSALPDPEIQDIVRANADRLEEYDGLTAAGLLSQVRRTQKQKYAVRDLRGLGGVRTVGVAIHADDGTPFAALSLSAIRSRMKEKRVGELAALLKYEASRVEKKLVGAQILAWEI